MRRTDAALKRLWGREPGDGTLTDKARREIATIACLAAEEAGGGCRLDAGGLIVEVEGASSVMFVEPGREGAVSLAHPGLKWLAARAVDSTVVTHAWYLGETPAFRASERGGVRL